MRAVIYISQHKIILIFLDVFSSYVYNIKNRLNLTFLEMLAEPHTCQNTSTKMAV
jgi:hypothetical protein